MRADNDNFTYPPPARQLGRNVRDLLPLDVIPLSYGRVARPGELPLHVSGRRFKRGRLSQMPGPYQPGQTIDVAYQVVNQFTINRLIVDV